MIKPQIHTNSINWFISLKSLHRYDIDICNRYISTISLQKSMCIQIDARVSVGQPGGGMFFPPDLPNKISWGWNLQWGWRVEARWEQAQHPLVFSQFSGGFFIGNSSLNSSKMMMLLSRNIEWFYPFTWSFWRLIDWFCACDSGVFSDWQHS